MAYFNKNYVNTEKFPKTIGRKIAQSSKEREDSDYDDEFVVNPDITKIQIETAEELIHLVDEFLKI